MTTYPLKGLPERSPSADIELAEAVSHIANVIPKSVVAEKMKEGAKDPADFVPNELFQWDVPSKLAATTSSKASDDKGEKSHSRYELIHLLFMQKLIDMNIRPVQRSVGDYDNFINFLKSADAKSPVDEETARKLLGEMYLIDWLCTGELQVQAERGGKYVEVFPVVFKIALNDEIDFIDTGEIPSTGNEPPFRFMTVKYGELRSLFPRVKRTGKAERKRRGAPSADYDLLREIMDNLMNKEPALTEESRAHVAGLMRDDYILRNGPKPPSEGTIVKTMKADFDRYWG
jgi:hypothetical protein